MRYSSDLPDTPRDPTDDDERIRLLPFPVMTWVDQPSLIRLRGANFLERTSRRGRDVEGAARKVEASVSLSYTLQSQREDDLNPNRPLNEEGDSGPISSNVTQNPSPANPAAWHGYPMLWEAVRTSWRDPSEPAVTVVDQLVMHMDHVLKNRFGEALNVPPGPPQDGDGWNHVRSTALFDVFVATETRTGIQIDGDPRVVGYGFEVYPYVICTVVIPREYVSQVEMRFREI